MRCAGFEDDFVDVTMEGGVREGGEGGDAIPVVVEVVGARAQAGVVVFGVELEDVRR